VTRRWTPVGSCTTFVDPGWIRNAVALLDGRTVHRGTQSPDLASKAVRPVASKVIGVSEATARNLLVHCAQEMNHLAGFLPELYESLGNE